MAIEEIGGREGLAWMGNCQKLAEEMETKKKC